MTPGGVQDVLVLGKCSVDILARGRTRAVRRPGAGKGDGGEEVMEAKAWRRTWMWSEANVEANVEANEVKVEANVDSGRR